MNARRAAGLLVRALGLVVLVAAGIYLLIYLYRWEWNRALIAGMFVLAAELAVIGGSLSRRLRKVERSLDLQAHRDREQRIRERLAAAPAPPTVSFAWLREPTDGAAVFVPLLLGAGAVLSALAYVVERIAVGTADPALQRDVASRLTRLQLPEGGFRPRPVPDRVPPIGLPADGPGIQPARRLLLWTVIVLVGGLLTTSAIVALAGATQARNEPDRSGQQTVMTIEIESRVPNASAAATFDLLWGACHARIPRNVAVETVEVLSPGTVSVTVDRGLGRTSARKLGGCLEDSLLDLVHARIADMVVLTGSPAEAPVDPRFGEPSS